MAIAFDANSPAEGIVTSGNSTATYTATPGSISNGILIVGAAYWSGNHSLTVTGVTFNGVSLTNIAKRKSAASQTGDDEASLWYLVNPASGARSVVLTFSPVAPAGGIFWSSGASSYSGVDQTTPLGTAAVNNGTSATASVVVTSATDELVVDVVYGQVPVVGGGQTQRWTQTVQEPAAGSEEAGAASVTMSWSLDSSAIVWAIIGVPLKPVAAAAGEQGRILLLH